MTIQDVIEIVLDEYIRRVKEDFQSERINATGQTVNAIRKEVSGLKGTVYAPFHIGASEYGRKPTQQAGEPLYPKILNWVRNKPGFQLLPDGVKNSKYSLEERIAKRITWSIHRQGTYLFRNGADGKYRTEEKVLSRHIPEIMQMLSENISKELTEQLRSQIIKSLQNVPNS